MPKGRPKGELECDVKVAEKAEPLEDRHPLAVVVVKDGGAQVFPASGSTALWDQIGNTWCPSLVPLVPTINAACR